MNAATDIARFLYTCKQCGKTQRREYPVRAVPMHPPFRGVRREYGVQNEFGPEVIWRWRRPDAFNCCGVSGHGAEVKGTLSEAKCGPSCKEATGPDCVCSCLGKSHGINI